MKKLMLGLFIAFGFSSCSLGNDDMNVDCGANTDVDLQDFLFYVIYAIKFDENATALFLTLKIKMESYFFKT